MAGAGVLPFCAGCVPGGGAHSPTGKQGQWELRFCGRTVRTAIPLPIATGLVLALVGTAFDTLLALLTLPIDAAICYTVLLAPFARPSFVTAFAGGSAVRALK